LLQQRPILIRSGDVKSLRVTCKDVRGAIPPTMPYVQYVYLGLNKSIITPLHSFEDIRDSWGYYLFACGCPPIRLSGAIITDWPNDKPLTFQISYKPFVFATVHCCRNWDCVDRVRKLSITNSLEALRYLHSRATSKDMGRALYVAVHSAECAIRTPRIPKGAEAAGRRRVQFFCNVLRTGVMTEHRKVH